MSEISEIQGNGQTHSDKIIPKPKISLAIIVKYALYSYISMRCFYETIRDSYLGALAYALVI